jgi:hypothetical protein
MSGEEDMGVLAFEGGSGLPHLRHGAGRVKAGNFFEHNDHVNVTCQLTKELMNGPSDTKPRRRQRSICVTRGG